MEIKPYAVYASPGGLDKHRCIARYDLLSLAMQRARLYVARKEGRDAFVDYEVWLDDERTELAVDSIDCLVSYFWHGKDCPQYCEGHHRPVVGVYIEYQRLLKDLLDEERWHPQSVADVEYGFTPTTAEPHQ